jgi:catalase
MNAAFQCNLKRCPFFRLLQTNYFFKADSDYGTRVDKYLELDVKEVEKLASMTKEELTKATEK